jgi:hypothetical protein
MWLLAPFRLTFRWRSAFRREQCAQTAAALSFATSDRPGADDRRGSVALISNLPLGMGLDWVRRWRSSCLPICCRTRPG